MKKEAIKHLKERCFFRIKDDTSSELYKVLHVARNGICYIELSTGTERFTRKTENIVMVVDSTDIFLEIRDILFKNKTLKNTITAIIMTEYNSIRLYAHGIGSVEMLSAGGISRVRMDQDIASGYSDMPLNKDNILETINEIIVPGIISMVEAVSSLDALPVHIQKYLWSVKSSVSFTVEKTMIYNH